MMLKKYLASTVIAVSSVGPWPSVRTLFTKKLRIFFTHFLVMTISVLSKSAFSVNYMAPKEQSPSVNSALKSLDYTSNL